MAIKILLDAGHYSGYNVSPVNSKYNEGDRMWDLHLLLKTELEAYGVTVDTTRSSKAADKDVYNRGTAGKGYDLVISEHSNASTTETTDYPVVIVPFNDKATTLGELIAQTIAEAMDTAQSGRTMKRTYVSGNNTYDYYGIIRGAVAVGAPGIIIENSFHTNPKMTAWLLDDDNLKKLAKAEAKTIAEYLGININGKTKTTSKCNFYKKSNIVNGSYCTLAKGTAVTIVEDQKNGWSKASYNGKTGFIKNTCIKNISGLSGYKKGIITKDVSLRSNTLVEKSTDTGFIIKKDAKVTIISTFTQNGRKWCNVKKKINGKSTDCYIVKSKVNI